MTLLGFCKLVSENWTYMCYTSHMMAFLMLFMIGEVVFDKTQVWSKKWRFYVQTYQILVLDFSELIRDNTNFSFGNEYLGLELVEGGNWGMVVSVGW